LISKWKIRSANQTFENTIVSKINTSNAKIHLKTVPPHNALKNINLIEVVREWRKLTKTSQITHEQTK